MLFADRMTIDGATRRRTADGYLLVEAKPARTGIQMYHPGELGVQMDRMVRVYRPEGEVFSTESLASYAGKPVTDDHPDVRVDSSNWKDLAKGFVGTEIARDGETIRVPLMLADAETIQKVEGGKVELSAGYTCKLDWTPGTAPDGQNYDAVQTAIKINHVAIVDAGRAGAACRILDSGKSSQPKGDRKMGENLKTITVDGIPVEVTDQAAAVIKKLEDKTAALTADLAKKEGEAAALKATADQAAANAAAKIADLEKKVADAETSLDDRIAERAAVIDTASKILGKTVEAKGKTVADIRRETVEAKLGDAAKGKDAVFIDGAFTTLAAQISTQDSLQQKYNQPPAQGTTQPITSKDQAYQGYLAHLATAHQTKGA